MNANNAEFLRLHVVSGWNQARTARELALDPSTVSLFLRDKATPSLTVLRLFAGLIGERLLLPGESPSPNALRDGPRWLEDWESDVMTTLRRLEPTARKRVVVALREIVDAIAKPARYRPPEKPPEDDPLPTMVQLIENEADRLRAAAPTSLLPPMYDGNASPDAEDPQPTDDAPSPPPSLALPGPTKRQRSVGKHPAP